MVRSIIIPVFRASTVNYSSGTSEDLIRLVYESGFRALTI